MVPPPAPVPTMITSYVSMRPPVFAWQWPPSGDDSEAARKVHRPERMKHPGGDSRRIERARAEAEQAVRETLTQLAPAISVEIATAAVPIAGDVAATSSKPDRTSSRPPT